MMNLCNGEQFNSELLQSQTHIWNHIFHFISSMSLKSAIELEIPDIIHNHGGSISLSNLIQSLPINKQKSASIKRLMRILIHSGFFINLKIPKTHLDNLNISKTQLDNLNFPKSTIGEDNEEEDVYGLTPSSRLLLKGEPLSVRPFLQAMLNPVLVDPWHGLSTWFRNDDCNPFETAHGKTFWDYTGKEGKLNELFNDAMASDARLVMNVVLKECRGAFEELNSIVDVGGGTGTVAMAIAEAFPAMTCINFDLPHVICGLEGEGNLKHVAGDMFVAVPPADAVLLKWILHDWSDGDSVKILKRCKEAIPSREKGGKLMIIDMVMENKGGGDDRSKETQLYFDMLMMVLVSGRERSEEDWAKLFFDSGFSHYTISPILGLRSLIQVYP